MIRAFVKAVVLLLFASGIFAPTSAFADFNAKVVGVSDGDTITVVDANRRQIKIRLHGIDAPEKGQSYSDAAKRFLSDRIFGKRVVVRDRKQDGYGRTIAIVYHQISGGKPIDVNASVVEAGPSVGVHPLRQRLCWPGGVRPSRRPGLWRDPRPMPPWEWRKAKREKH